MHRKQAPRQKASGHIVSSNESVTALIHQATMALGELQFRVISDRSYFIYGMKAEEMSIEARKQAENQIAQQIAEINKTLKGGNVALRNQIAMLEIKFLAYQADVNLYSAGSKAEKLDSDIKKRIHDTFKKINDKQFSCAGDEKCQQALFYLFELYTPFEKELTGRMDLVGLVKILLNKCDDSFIQIKLISRFMYQCSAGFRARLIINSTDVFNILESASKKIFEKVKDVTDYSALNINQQMELLLTSMMCYEFPFLYSYIFISERNKKRFRVTTLEGEAYDINKFDVNLPILEEVDEKTLIAVLQKDKELQPGTWGLVLKLLKSISFRDLPKDIEFHLFFSKVIQHSFTYSTTQFHMFGELLDRFNCKEINLNINTVKMLSERVKVWRGIYDECKRYAENEKKYSHDAFKTINPGMEKEDKLEDEMVDALFEKKTIEDFLATRSEYSIKNKAIRDTTSESSLTLSSDEKMMSIFKKMPEDERMEVAKLVNDKSRRERFLIKFVNRMEEEITAYASNEFQVEWDKLIAKADKYYLEVLESEARKKARHDRIEENNKTKEKNRAESEKDLKNLNQISIELEDQETVVEQQALAVKPKKFQLLELYDMKTIELSKSLFKNSGDILGILRARSKLKFAFSAEMIEMFDDRLKENLDTFERLLELKWQYQALAASCNEDSDMVEGIRFSMLELEEATVKISQQLEESASLIQAIQERIENDFPEFIQQLGLAVVANQPNKMNLTSKEIFDLGWKRYVEIGKTKQAEGLLKSDYAFDREYFRSCSKQYPAAVNALVPASNSHKIKLKSPAILPCLKVDWPIIIHDYFLKFKGITGKVFLCGGALSKIILASQGAKIEEFQDVDFVTTGVNLGEAMTVDNRFRSSKHKPLLCTLKDGAINVDLFFSEEKTADLSLDEWMTQDVNQRHFTAFSLIADESGNVYDPTGKGLVDLLAKRLRMIAEPKKALDDDPVRALIAIYKMLEGYKPDQALADAMDQWQAKENLDMGHLKAVAAKHLKSLSYEKKLEYVELLTQYGLLNKMFGCMAPTPKDALDLLNKMLVAGKGGNQQGFFNPRQSQMMVPGLQDPQLLGVSHPPSRPNQ